MVSACSFNTTAPSFEKAFSARARLGHLVDSHIGVSTFLFDRVLRPLYPFGAVRL